MVRKSYNDEFKCEAIRLPQERGNICEVAHDLSIGHVMFQRWAKRMDRNSKRPFLGKCNHKDGELAALKRAHNRLHEENEI